MVTSPGALPGVPRQRPRLEYPPRPVEIGMTNPSRTMRIPSPKDTAASRLASVQALAKPSSCSGSIWQLNSRPETRNIIGQSNSQLHV